LLGEFGGGVGLFHSLLVDGDGGFVIEDVFVDEALFEEGDAGFRAMCALQAIGHCAKQQIQWFNKTGTFFDVHPPMAILRQERFAEDMAGFLRQIGHDSEAVALCDDPDRAHRTDYTDTPPLSEKALANLRAWYRPDYEFYKWCGQWVAKRTQGET
jgi:hypothetical protein